MSAPVKLSIILPYAVFQPSFHILKFRTTITTFSPCMLFRVLYAPAHPDNLLETVWQYHKVSACHLLQILPPH